MKRYGPEIHHFITENVKGTTAKALAKLVNEKFGTDFTESKMKAYKTNHKLKSGTLCGLPAGRPTDLYPDDVQNYIKENCTGVGPKAMTKLLNENFGTKYTHVQMKTYYRNRGINSGLDGRFEPGHIPANKGRKGVDGWKPTQFKKGQKPPNWKPIGSERVNGDGYIDIKVQDGKKQKNWKAKHIIIWEKEHGPVPKGHVVIFGDGNNRNFDTNNLILVSRKQLATLNKNKLIQKDADLTRTGIIIADLQQKISQRRIKRKLYIEK